MRKAATSRGTTGLVLEGVRVARVALVKAVRSSSRAVSGTSASKRKTRRGGRVGGGLGAAHGAGAWCPARAVSAFSVEEGMGLPLLYHVALLMPSVSHGFSRLMLCSARYSSRGKDTARMIVLIEQPNFSAISLAVISRFCLTGGLRAITGSLESDSANCFPSVCLLDAPATG